MQKSPTAASMTLTAVRRVATSNVTRRRKSNQPSLTNLFKNTLGVDAKSQKQRNTTSSLLQFFAVLSQFINLTSGQIRTLLLLRSDTVMEISLPKLAGLIFFFFSEASQSRKQCRVLFKWAVVLVICQRGVICLVLSRRLRWLGGVSPDRHVGLHAAKMKGGRRDILMDILVILVNTGIVMDMQDMFTNCSAMIWINILICEN